MKQDKILIIVDPQNDFINGSLPVPEAGGAMNNLADYILSHGPEYSTIIITGDRHPANHCSFASEGGQWPSHCVDRTPGAEVWPHLKRALDRYSDITVYVYKGGDRATEEYSILRNKEAASIIDRIIKNGSVGELDICGLAGDICVADTIGDLNGKYPGLKINVLRKFSPSIDGGKTLDNLTSNNSFVCDR